MSNLQLTRNVKKHQAAKKKYRGTGLPNILVKIEKVTTTRVENIQLVNVGKGRSYGYRISAI